MILRNALVRWMLAALAVPVCLTALATAQAPAPQEPNAPKEESRAAAAKPQPAKAAIPVPAEQPAAEGPVLSPQRRRELLTRGPGEHPLVPAIRWAREGLRDLAKVKDYSAVMVRRDRQTGKVGPYQYSFLKVRQKPLSVYLHFLAPEDCKGQEVIYVEGKNEGRMWAHGVGYQRMFGTVSLLPTGPVAMLGQRYPITEIGMENMMRRLVEVGEKDAKYGECEVRYFEHARINDRPCTCIQVVHAVPRRNFLFYVARIFVDDERNLPLRYEAYDWPTEPGGPPLLSEEYTYLNVKVNVGFTDADFDTRNVNYDFP